MSDMVDYIFMQGDISDELNRVEPYFGGYKKVTKVKYNMSNERILYEYNKGNLE